jgi:hypothetical protein
LKSEHKGLHLLFWMNRLVKHFMYRMGKNMFLFLLKKKWLVISWGRLFRPVLLLYQNVKKGLNVYYRIEYFLFIKGFRAFGFHFALRAGIFLRDSWLILFR